MNVYNAKVIPSPSTMTVSGRKVLELDPDSPGSLGIAISEAMEIAAQDPYTKYSLGSVLNHVSLHQTIIGQEALLQMEKAGDYPDVVIGCFGGGSNFQVLHFRSSAKTLSMERKQGVSQLNPRHARNLQKENSCMISEIQQV